MNERFFALPKERQLAIVNAGYRVFSQNSYKKSPMSEIAAQAGISKSLLFHYFANKRELYLFLWEKAAALTLKYLNACGCYEPANLFEMMERGMRAKLRLLERYPYMAAFTVKAFYEKDPQIRPAVMQSYQRHFDGKAAAALAALNPADFVPGLDLQMMYRQMYWTSEGYLWEMLQRGPLDAARMQKDFEELLRFWKTVYQRREEPE